MSTALAAARAKTKGKRMLRDSLEAYGEDEFTISEWNRKKKEAERDGTWTWKQSVVSTNATIKVRFEKDGIKDALKARFVDMQDSMDQEMKSVLHAHQDDLVQGLQDGSGLTQCCWRECIGGKPYHCTNDVPVDKKKTKAGELCAVLQSRVKQFCRWHARECDNDDHPLEKSKAIEIPNELGLCLHCYEATAVTQRATLQKTPPRVIAIKIPGVCLADLRRDVKRDVLMNSKSSGMTASNKLTVRSVCSWQKEHYEKAFIWQCTNRVLMHPTLNGSYFSFCGFHAPRCIKEYGRKSKKGEICPPIDRLNGFGMCRNHLEAHLSTLNYEQRGSCILVNTEFDVPGIKECSRDPLVSEIKRHPLAPKHPPPSHDFPPQAMIDFATPIAMEALPESLAKRVAFISAMFVKNQVAGLLSLLLDGPNPISALLKEAIWRFQFLRRAEVVAIRIQRIFRGKRGRRRVHVLRCERAALKRIKACCVIQQFARGFLGRRRFQYEYERVNRAVPIIQRIMRGGLSRKRYRELRAAIRLQRNYRCYRQRLAAWALREEMEYMKSLQRQADANLREMEEKMYAFRRLRARRLLRAQMVRRKKQKEAKAHEAALCIQSFWSAVKIQRLWRRHQHYAGLKKRYQSAQCIQKRVRGWLTRHLWKEDPGILFITGYVNAKNGFEYGKIVILQQPSNSYSYPSRRTRMQYGALTIQRLFRGLLGRLKANEKWVEMLKRWEWIGIESTDSSGNSSDSMTVGKERYGFVLPSFNYHKESRRHMKPIIRNIKADRGFAYKYQYILNLIKDRDGKRAWSLAHEQRIQKEEQQLLESNQCKWTLVSSSSKTRDEFAHDLMLSPSISHAKAVFPVGSIVKVLVFNSGRKGKTFRCGKIVRIHNGRQGSKSATSFDIDYDPVLVSVHGVRIYNEQRVPANRIQATTHDEATQIALERQKSVGRLLQSAIAELKKDIREANHNATQVNDVSEARASERALDGITAIVDRLRDDRKGSDLLADDREFVNFVFRNSTLLEVSWLQVVDRIRYGVQRRNRNSIFNSETTPTPLPPTALEFFLREFGFDRQQRNSTRIVKPMPHRASAIEKRMIELGFTHTATANGRDERPGSNAIDRRETCNTEFTANKPKSLDHVTRDDSALDDYGSRIHSSQDLHRLLYELKTLPIERRREKIIQITTRSMRSFVCGHPACGRCFSSYEAARLHQKSTHEHKERLAVSTPLSDQYMHAYWPPQSPWNQETHAKLRHMIGYFRCSHPGCEQVEFRSHRDLNSHAAIHHPAAEDHTHVSAYFGGTSNSSSSRLPQIIWLGAYTICRSLHEKLGPLNGFEQLAPCQIHTKLPHESCKICVRLQNRPVLPCRLYSAAALAFNSKQDDDNRQLESADSQGESFEYIIFSVQDPEFCPAVHEFDLDQDINEKRLQSHSHVKSPGGADGIAYIKIASLCRDANGEEWALGHAFRSSTSARPGSSRLSVRQDVTDRHEVVLDEERLVFIKLRHVIGGARVRHCSKSMFYRKFFKREGQSATPDTSHRRAQPVTARGLAIVERFWRQSTPNDTPPPSR